MDSSASSAHTRRGIGYDGTVPSTKLTFDITGADVAPSHRLCPASGQAAQSLIASTPSRSSSATRSRMCWSTSGGCGSQSDTSPMTRSGSRVR
ncbi:MAG: hypothetical protein QOK15_1298 [Nocardioidaceae bacterium]|nr:hypothetical protein [Nocardioidaceae bacterium]